MRPVITTIISVALIAPAIGGCASSSSDITAAYISPLAYDTYSCVQLGAEMQRISSRVQQVSGSVDDRATNDQVAMGVGMILFWPALFMLKGNGPEAQELARLKGEYEAINQTAIRKNCGLTPQTTIAANPSPQAPAPIATAPTPATQPMVPVAN